MIGIIVVYLIVGLCCAIAEFNKSNDERSLGASENPLVFCFVMTLLWPILLFLRRSSGR